MKVKVKVVEEVAYEIELTPKQYFYAKVYLQSNDSLHELVLTKGKIVDCSRTWQSIETDDYEELANLFDRLDK